MLRRCLAVFARPPPGLADGMIGGRQMTEEQATAIADDVESSVAFGGTKEERFERLRKEQMKRSEAAAEVARERWIKKQMAVKEAHQVRTSGLNVTSDTMASFMNENAKTANVELNEFAEAKAKRLSGKPNTAKRFTRKSGDADDDDW
eukprot:TRINITY_DN7505_c0_g1_i1.p2 TRINITY_DN7505_c0_g1~~TRINITY_DN7505_c0_g1_i1.p2  ORF type:complete len:148 (+),score=38.00 TRINITY_DN7505_c0_g1_i1:266-709(+)